LYSVKLYLQFVNIRKSKRITYYDKLLKSRQSKNDNETLKTKKIKLKSVKRQTKNNNRVVEKFKSKKELIESQNKMHLDIIKNQYQEINEKINQKRATQKQQLKKLSN
jgi:Mg2+ and Co2+ transporter CorA